MINRLVPALAQVIASSSAGAGEKKRVALVVLRAVGRNHASVSKHVILLVWNDLITQMI